MVALLVAGCIFSSDPGGTSKAGPGDNPPSYVADTAPESAHLFKSTLVQSISVDLQHGAPTVPTEAGMPPGSLELRLSPIRLEVDQRDGVHWVVEGDIQDMFFRKGMAEAGEDTTRWYLFEWRDLPGRGLKPGAVAPAIHAATWGKLKSMY